VKRSGLGIANLYRPVVDLAGEQNVWINTAVVLPVEREEKLPLRFLCACEGRGCEECSGEPAPAPFTRGEREAIASAMPRKACVTHGDFGGLFCPDCGARGVAL
jgi:hypothetical protein